MKWIFCFLVFISSFSFGQIGLRDDSTKYIRYQNQYGMRIPRLWADSAMHAPYFDTAIVKPQKAGAIMMHLDKNIYKWNGVGWEPISTSTILSNIGSGYRWVATSSGQIKTLVNGYGILADSTTNANSITIRADTSSTNHLVTQADLNDAISGTTNNIQQVLTNGDTTLRKIIWKDTASATGTNGLDIAVVRPSNYGTVYTNGEGGLFNTTIAKFSGVNPDGRPNVVYNFLGYNVSPGGGRLNTNEASFRFAAETHYQLDIAQNPAFEFHLPEITTFSGATYRPLSLYIRKNSGFTNANMQVDQLNLARRLSGVNWSSHAYDSNVVVTYTADTTSKNVSINAVLAGGGTHSGTLTYTNLGWSISSNIPAGKAFGTNLPINYGSSTNLSGVDGYGNVTFREGKVTMFNTGANTTFADWQFNSVQAFSFTNSSAVFSKSLITVGSANLVPVGGSKLLAANNEPLLISSSGGAGSDIRFLNGVDNARQVTIFQAASGAGNVNIGASTTNPARKLKVQGSVGIDSNLYVAMHTIASDADSAITWDRSTNVYKYAKINAVSGSGTSGRVAYWNGSSTLTSGSNFLFDGSTLTVQSSGAAAGIYGASNSGNGVVAESTSGEALAASVIPSSTNTLVTVGRLQRFTSGTAANDIGGAFDWFTQSSGGSAQRSNRIGSSWSNATTGSRTSILEFFGVNSATEARKAALAGNGQWIWDGYGAGTHTGTLASYLVSTSSGAVVEQAASTVPLISTGTAAPATTPGKVGDMFIDTVNKKLYFATGTSSSADWTIAN
jgi:hypothetical protein